MRVDDDIQRITEHFSFLDTEHRYALVSEAGQALPLLWAERRITLTPLGRRGRFPTPAPRRIVPINNLWWPCRSRYDPFGSLVPTRFTK
jgi:hypothetical protein